MATPPLCSKSIIARPEICAPSSRRLSAISILARAPMFALARPTRWSLWRLSENSSNSVTRTATAIIMDPETYDTITLQENLIGDAKDYLVENLSVQVLYAEGKPVQVELPASVSLKVTESPEGLRGDTASNVTKPAKLETGKTINVPLFIKEGELIKIDTRTGAYMGRA